MTDERSGSGSAPTLHDVAREAGVSLATASRALNGSTRRVADDYRERVEAAAAALGYTPNISAQAIARGTSATVALLVADIADAYFGQIASGVAQAASASGLVLTMAMTERDPRAEAALLRTLRGQRPRGVILAASRDDAGEDAGLAAEVAGIARIGGRVVTLGAAVNGTRVVAYDNVGGARDLGARLAAIGYRRAVVVAGPRGLRTSEDRLAGFAAGFTGSGGTVAAVVHAPISRDGGHRAASDLIGAGMERGTLLFGISDVVAIGALSAVREAGREPGQDIAVCGFDDIVTSRDITPTLTTVRVPLERIGAEALRAVADADWAGAVIPPLEVVVRGSTPPR